MNLSEFEQKISAQPLRQLPNEWKKELLGDSHLPKRQGKAHSGFRLAALCGLVPRRLAMPLAAAWIAIVFLRMLTPHSDTTPVYHHFTAKTSSLRTGIGALATRPDRAVARQSQRDAPSPPGTRSKESIRKWTTHSPSHHKPSSLVKTKILKYAIRAALILVTLVVLFYAIENFRGARAWKSAQTELQAAGVSMELDDLLSDRIPDDENFCAIPLLDNLTLLEDGTANGEISAAKRERLWTVTIVDSAHFETTKPPTKGILFVDLEKTDLGAWKHYFEMTDIVDIIPADSAAEAVLAGLEDAYGDVFSELDNALDRPHSQFTPPLQQRLEEKPLYALPLPHFPAIQSITAALKLRALAAIQCGNTNTAINSLLSIARLIQATSEERLVISWLVKMTLIAVIERSVWELLLERCANDAQLANLQHQLSQIEPRNGLRECTSMELLFALEFMDFSKKRFAGETVDVFGTGDRLRANLEYLMPDGWWDQNKANYARLLLDSGTIMETLPSFSEAKGFAANAERIAESMNGPYSFAAKMSVPVIQSFQPRAFLSEWMITSMITAIALERHYLAHDEYPESLDALVPKFLPSPPTDPCSAMAPIYRKTVGGRYVLYSVGYDEIDNGAVLHPKNTRLPRDYTAKTGDKLEGYDWVWRFSESSPVERR